MKLFNYLVFSVFYKKPYNIIFISIFASKKELINTISSLFLDHCLYFIFIIIYKFHRSWYSCFIINSCSIIFCQIFNWCNSPCMKNCILYSICRTSALHRGASAGEGRMVGRAPASCGCSLVNSFYHSVCDALQCGDSTGNGSGMSGQ